jgi:leukotriene-A4 hydrolase
MRALINRYIAENKYTSIKWEVLRDLYDNFVDGAFTNKKEAQAK